MWVSDHFFTSRTEIIFVDARVTRVDIYISWSAYLVKCHKGKAIKSYQSTGQNDHYEPWPSTDSFNLGIVWKQISSNAGLATNDLIDCTFATLMCFIIATYHRRKNRDNHDTLSEKETGRSWFLCVCLNRLNYVPFATRLALHHFGDESPLWMLGKNSSHFAD